jgi:hypothetical protein
MWRSLIRPELRRGPCIWAQHYINSNIVPLSPREKLNVLRKDVLKKIHPDLFACAPKVIQHANLICVQDLNEFWNILSILLPALDAKNYLPEPLIPQIKALYKLRCFRYTIPESDKEKFMEIECTILIPPKLFMSLSQGQSMNRDIMRETLRQVIVQHAVSFIPSTNFC